MGLGRQVLNVPICDLESDRHVPRKVRPLGGCQGAQYERKLPCREAPPFRAWSFQFAISYRSAHILPLDN